MDSNLITAPDFVSADHLHTVTVIDPAPDDIDLLIKICQYGAESYNLYVYRADHPDSDWLDRAVALSDTVIVNTEQHRYDNICLLDKTYYYGPYQFVENPRKLAALEQYFVYRQSQNK